MVFGLVFVAYAFVASSRSANYATSFVSQELQFNPQSIGDTRVDMSVQRLTALRSLMATQLNPLAAYIVPTSDAHNSEYISPSDARREWLSGFTGSAGVAVVTEGAALLWTDGRYYTQFEKQVDMTHWKLMKQSLPDTPKLENWLAKNLTAGSVVGVDPTTLTRQLWTPLQKTLSDANIKLEAIKKNLVDEARRELNDHPPPRKFNVPYTLPVKYTGKTSGQKVSELRKKMEKKTASVLVLTALDDIAYTLNLRGTDIKYNPVFFSYLAIEKDAVILFWSDGVLPNDVTEHFKNEGLGPVTAKPYEEIFDYLQKTALQLQAEEGGARSIWLSHDASEAIHMAAAGGPEAEKQIRLISEVSPVAVAKVVKNDVELQGIMTPTFESVPRSWSVDVPQVLQEKLPYIKGMRDCHIRDGVAVIRFFRWLHQQLDDGASVTEIEAADKLEEFRKSHMGANINSNESKDIRIQYHGEACDILCAKRRKKMNEREEEEYMGPSFETIAGAGENGAIIHYSPDRNGVQKKIERGEMFLLDSGGQYRDGTTDITRTRHMSGQPTEEQKAAFTRVLIGQISMGDAVFPKGVKGNVLDTLARKALWDVGLDYAHGTGHGVGHHLNVHEGPSGISWRTYPDDPGLQPAMIFSNEPGYYKVGEYGIRHEDLVEVIEVNNSTDHPKAKQLIGNFDGRGVIGFRTLTLVPQQKECIEIKLLNQSQLERVNAYHRRVFDVLGPILKSRGLEDDYVWLESECEPIIV